MVSAGPARLTTWLYAVSVSPFGASHFDDSVYLSAVPWVSIAMNTPSAGLNRSVINPVRVLPSLLSDSFTAVTCVSTGVVSTVDMGGVSAGYSGSRGTACGAVTVDAVAAGSMDAAASMGGRLSAQATNHATTVANATAAKRTDTRRSSDGRECAFKAPVRCSDCCYICSTDW